MVLDIMLWLNRKSIRCKVVMCDMDYSLLQASVIGVVVPNPEELCQFVKKKLNIECASMAQLCARLVSDGTL